ncbi:MAG: DGQHR domain-containing protein [Verrucomicrobia bacterium]|nr:DGQHR domain-containing protein [Verrucomicrobiota bacterium]
MPESIRSTRVLNQDTVERIARYVSANPKTYVLSPLLVSVDGDARFVPLLPEAEIGQLHIAMEARFVVNGGEHEKAALEKVLTEQPELAAERIPVVFQPDKRLRRAARIYAELKMFSVRPSASLRLLNSVDDDSARLARELAEKSKPFQGLVEMKRSSIAPRSRMLFTLSAVHQATKALLAGLPPKPYEERLALALRFWNSVERQFPEWGQVRSGKILSSALRARFIHSHALALQAIGKVGNSLLQSHPDDWEGCLASLRQIDWRRENTKDWEGRAFIGGKVSKAMANVVLTSNLLKKAIGIALLPSEKTIEQAHQAGKARR